MTEEKFRQYLDKSVTLFGGQLKTKQQYLLFTKVVNFLIKRGFYVITGGLAKDNSIMYEPVKICADKVITVYSKDDELSRQHLLITPRQLSYTAPNFGHQIYLMIQSRACILFDGGWSTYTEMTMALDNWKRNYAGTSVKPPILFFSRVWLSYREMLLEDGLLDPEVVRKFFIYCHGYNRFVRHFSNFFPT